MREVKYWGQLTLHLAFLTVLKLPHAWAYDLTLPHDTKTEIYFSPRGGGTEAIVKHLEGAKTTIYVQAYSFTSPSITQARIEAQARGVRVEVILNKSQSRGRGAAGNLLREAG